ncbi:hypothetical protein E3Q08_01298 [Wallemia mellicola]|nr:hypothetical protein E3Q16_01195 [Wallemia mellicola]TIC12831.1 hypothetical protein E3Q15_02169 [Wallemia mellicola]TIC35218.1 hypothetical protein E3Q09_02419 [Wallemia mellicola]TIC45355.1 hypothetical protein E3Q08_01298 [Wallemia mellicola]TIC54613.1 hypothetical protein E3Q04_02393 [Wallemia mellicola]
MKTLFKKRTQQNQQPGDNKEDLEQHHIASAVRAALIPPRRGSLYDNLGGMDSDTSPIIPVNNSIKNNSSSENIKESTKADKHASQFSSQPSHSPRNSDEDHFTHPEPQHEDNEEPHTVSHADHPPNYSADQLEGENSEDHRDSISIEPPAQSDLPTFSPIPSTSISYVTLHELTGVGVSTPTGLTLPPFSPFNPLAHPPPIANQFMNNGTPPTSPRDVRRAARQLPTLARGSRDLPPLPLAEEHDQAHESADVSESDDDSEESSEEEEEENVEEYRRPSIQQPPSTDYFSLPSQNPLSPSQTPRAHPPMSPGINSNSRATTSSVLPPKLNQRAASSVTVQQRSRENTQSTVDSVAPTSEDSSTKDKAKSPEALRRLTSSIMLTAVDNPAHVPPPTELPSRTSSHKDVTVLGSAAQASQKLSVASPKIYGRQMSRSLTDLSSFQSPEITEGLPTGLHPSVSAGADVSAKGKEKAEPQTPAITIDQAVESSTSTREIAVGTSPPVTPAMGHTVQMEQERLNWKDVVQNTPLSPPPPLTPLSTHGSPSAGRRRMSLPNMTVAPPQYEDVALRETIFGGIRRVIRPREEEGNEKLPTYKCGIHIEGLMPRKMEFTSPGNQARDRTWRRVYAVLHGTVLKVYKADRWDHDRAVLSSEINDLNEADQESAYVHQPPPADAPIPPVPALPQLLAQRPSFQNHINAPPNNIRYAPTLLRSYSLQNAESGLAADYVKRRNVIRVRLLSDKGVKEQFLIQAYDQSSVIDWIEALQAATNVSLDLDSRPMPKLTTLPRRRRRRRVRQEDLSNGNTDAIEAAQTEAAIQASLRNNQNADNISTRSGGLRANIRNSIRRNASQLRSTTSVNNI